MQNIVLQPIAIAHNTRISPTDDHWKNIETHITLLPHIPANALQGIAQFSHLEIIYYFNQVSNTDIVFCSHPRNNPQYDEMGIFAQRKKDRPNKIGLCTVQLLEHKDNTIKVRFFDGIHNTPILDIKPVFKEFEPQSNIVQPTWVSNLMQQYW